MRRAPFPHQASTRSETGATMWSMAERQAKFWQPDVTLLESRGLGSGELLALRRLVFAHRVQLQEAWDGHFGR